MLPKARDPRIDYVRVAAIGFILLHHSDDYGVHFLTLTQWETSADDALTYAALAALFCISGYLAFRTSARGSASGIGHFRRRLERLYIPFALALVLFRLLQLFPLSWAAVGVNLALLGPWSGPAVPTLWFVEVLLFYHAVYAMWLASRPLRTRPWTIPVVLGVITLGGGVATLFAGLTPDPRVAVYLPAFAGGAFLATMLSLEDQSRAQAAAWSSAAIVVLGLVLRLVPVWKGVPSVGLGISLGTSLAMAVVLSLPRNTEAITASGNGLVRTIAHGSFMAYLVHRILFSFAADAVSALGDVWVSVVIVACIPLVLGAGVLLQRGYDAVASGTEPSRRRTIEARNER